MARQEGPGPARFYDATKQWVDRCLRRDDSLFTPGRAIWTAAVVNDLHERFVKRPDESDRDFLAKFHDQVSDGPPETVQLAAEILYVHFLIARSVGGARKRELINQVLGWSSAPVAMPADLAEAMDHGLASCGTGFNTHRPFLIVILVEFARLWKSLPEGARDAALSDPWEFKRLVFSLKGRAAQIQQHALLHIVHPDSFEDIIADAHKHKFADAPAHARFVTDRTADVDRRLLEIRRGIEAETRKPFQFYADNDAAEGRVAEGGGIEYWKIAPGENGWQWNECREGGFIGIGWEELGDVSQMSYEEFAATKQRLVRERGWGSGGPEQVWKFSRIPPGSRVVANQGTSIALGFGTVTGPYVFESGARHGHKLPVRWDDVAPRSISEPSWVSTMRKLDQGKFEELLASPTVDPAKVVIPPRPDVEETPELPGTPASTSAVALPPHEIQPEYTLEMCAEDLNLPIEVLRRWLSALERKGQAVLYGPPGTGKTFVATHLARHLVGGSDGLKQIVQFHPSYAYEDFVQGIRPHAGDKGALAYSMMAGRFLEFCDAARERSGPCVLILDEINRANLSRVFGELMYLLEYRGQEVSLAGGHPFSIPSNVRLIGTMNTADRSIALVDHALRRRFAFLALHPDMEVLRRYHRNGDVALVEALVGVLQDLNQEIGDRHYEVGVSFFLHRDLGAHIEDIWRMEIEPYVEEFFFDQPARVAAIRWEHVRQRLGR